MANEKKLIYADDARRAILEAEPKLAYCIERIKAVDAVEVPPVKIGDTVYCVIGGKIFKAEVYFIRWEQHKQYGIHSDILATVVPNYSVGGSFDDFGKTVFLSKEEAEVALAKMQGGEKSGK